MSAHNFGDFRHGILSFSYLRLLILLWYTLLEADCCSHLTFDACFVAIHDYDDIDSDHNSVAVAAAAFVRSVSHRGNCLRSHLVHFGCFFYDVFPVILVHAIPSGLSRTAIAIGVDDVFEVAADIAFDRTLDSRCVSLSTGHFSFHSKFSTQFLHSSHDAHDFLL